MFWVKKILGSKKKFWVIKIFWVKKFIWVKKIFGIKIFLVKEKFWSKKFVGKSFFFSKIFGWKFVFFFLKKNLVGLTQGGGYKTAPPPAYSRVKIVLDCCQFCLLRSPTKFLTPRIIISGRSRVCVVVGGVGGV